MPEHPHHPPPPPGPKPHWAAIENLPDAELLRFAPPEIRRLHTKLTAVEAALAAQGAELAAMRELLTEIRARLPAPPGAP
jgi:hypothetical protein